MPLEMEPSNPPFALGRTILHEGHDHAASSGPEWTTAVGAIVFLAVVAVGTWYVYENYRR